MISNGTGGGSTITGVNFEKGRDLVSVVLRLEGYSVDVQKTYNSILFRGVEVAKSFTNYIKDRNGKDRKKNKFYPFLKSKGIDWKAIISRKLNPDDAAYVIKNNTLFVIEMKFQNTDGSVDEKLQTCDFKKKQYKKLLSPLNMEVEYIYILDEWYLQPKYKDVRDYVHAMGCSFYFNYLPLDKIGLPVSDLKTSVMNES